MHPGTVPVALGSSNVSIPEDMMCKVPVMLRIYESRYNTRTGQMQNDAYPCYRTRYLD